MTRTAPSAMRPRQGPPQSRAEPPSPACAKRWRVAGKRLNRASERHNRGAQRAGVRTAKKRSEQPSGGRGRRAQNRSVRVVHADSEHRPRLPGGCAVVLLAALGLGALYRALPRQGRASLPLQRERGAFLARLYHAIAEPRLQSVCAASSNLLDDCR
ncbi:hypothetical protein XFF6992_370157 [Xanthomonas citri pv. fuscans]|nr:hypothetical protein XFF6992_370157 [Xanthomonas citri pv. fuscans]SOO33883.1 hypothetical protein XFF6994_3270009 [Xanthomonas citri pv. fuscans]